MKCRRIKSMVMLLMVLVGILSAAIGVSASYDPYVGEIVLFPYTFAPRGWAACDGQLIPISQNTALFALLGTKFGGDGKSTFALPNLNYNAEDGISANPLGENRGLYCIALQGIFPARP